MHLACLAFVSSQQASVVSYVLLERHLGSESSHGAGKDLADQLFQPRIFAINKNLSLEREGVSSGVTRNLFYYLWFLQGWTALLLCLFWSSGTTALALRHSMSAPWCYPKTCSLLRVMMLVLGLGKGNIKTFLAQHLRPE